MNAGGPREGGWGGAGEVVAPVGLMPQAVEHQAGGKDGADCREEPGETQADGMGRSESGADSAKSIDEAGS